MYHPADAQVMLPIVTIAYLIILLFVLKCSWLLGLRLIGSGLVTAVYATWCGLLPAGGEASVQFQAGQAGVSMGGGAGGTLGRVAVLLVLAGVATVILGHLNSPAVPPSQKEVSRGNPQ